MHQLHAATPPAASIAPAPACNLLQPTHLTVLEMASSSSRSWQTDVVKHSRAASLAGAGRRGDASGYFGCLCWPQPPVLLPILFNQYVELLLPGLLLGEPCAHVREGGRGRRSGAAARGRGAAGGGRLGGCGRPRLRLQRCVDALAPVSSIGWVIRCVRGSSAPTQRVALQVVRAGAP